MDARSASRIVLAPMLLLLAGCASGNAANAFRAAHPQCGGDVAVQRRGDTMVWDVAGCGTEATVHAMCVTGQGCRHLVSSVAVERAAFETGCDPRALRTTVLSDTQVGIEGCGRRMVYVMTLSGWVLDHSGGSGPGVTNPAIVR